jgi:sec-independent protein translocase protein TatA
MFANLTGWHALILLAVVLLVFGAAKLPALAKSVGQSVRILKKEVKAPDSGASAHHEVDPSIAVGVDHLPNGDPTPSPQG